MAQLTNIYHLSSHDGYGARTTLFFKGCSLHCAWCHNPETIASSREIVWQQQLCIGCGSCMKGCPQGALHLERGLDFINRSECRACGTCADVCPSKAIHFSSKGYTVEQVTQVIRKDKGLFQAMKGGVTFSGGEPALHSQFIEDVIDTLDDKSIHYALDTCGQAPYSAYQSLLPKLGLVLFDIKEMNPTKHKKFTGSDNILILENLSKIASQITEQRLPTKIWIRTPLIPDHTASIENIEAIAALLATLPVEVIERWEICCFNNLCTDKYKQLGREWALSDYELFDSREGAKYLEAARKSAPHLDIRLTGLRKRDE